MILRLALAAALGAATGAACAQDAAEPPGLATPDGFAGTALEVCVRPSPDDADLDAAGFSAREGAGDGPAVYDGPGAAELTLARRAGFRSCELRVPEVTQEGFEALAGAFAAKLGEMFDATSATATEDGMGWVFTHEAAETEVLLQLDDTGTLVLTAATRAGEPPDPATLEKAQD